jgi:hypothetical protein
MKKIPGNVTRLALESIVEMRLSATGLFVRKGQFHAQSFQEMRHILERSGVELVAKTGDE